MKLIELNSNDVVGGGYTIYINLASVAYLQESHGQGDRSWNVYLNSNSILITKAAFDRIKLAMESQ